MKWVFDELLEVAGTSLDDIVSYHQADLLCRHGWRDGSRLDLFADRHESAKAIESFSDRDNADGYLRFCEASEQMFNTLQRTYIDAARPNMLQFVSRIGALNFRELTALKPLNSMWSELGRYFSDPRLQQLFGRYATYCGSSPYFAPSTLMLVAAVEQQGVWIADGGMHGVAKALAGVAEAKGASFHYGSGVLEIEKSGDQVSGVVLENGQCIDATRVIFNGDVSALANGLLGETGEVSPVKQKDRSLSALTWTVKAKAKDFPLSHHNVFFSDQYPQEFDQIFASGHLPEQPTVYICAQDRNDNGQLPEHAQDGESLLLLVNAPPVGDKREFTEDEIQSCLMRTQAQLEACGLKLDMTAQQEMPRTQLRGVAASPNQFEQLFPQTGGALYGPLSKGMMAAFKRQGAKTKLKGLYLAGGSVHPGSGVPMAVLSGRRAAETLVSDLDSMR
jgi:1-hydroxycarotenoid 3,4-desaturase